MSFDALNWVLTKRKSLHRTSIQENCTSSQSISIQMSRFDFDSLKEWRPASANSSINELTSQSPPMSSQSSPYLSPTEDLANKTVPATAMKDMTTTTSLEDLQTDEQRRVLDTVAQVRKCGLESVLSLPQLVVCGDQSAGKSSVLEALTEIPFPRNDNLCTRFATEIILRRANVDSLTIKVIPDSMRPSSEQASIREFEETITDFADLPVIMAKAMCTMGIKDSTFPDPDSKPRAFARDVLSIEIEGPSRPQLTLVDIPGLIQTATKGVTEADVELVTEITDHYISQPRTICLAVITATNDHANQKILTKVRQVDPEGNRTLGIITKPDRLSKGSGSEKAFIDLARNEDVFFKLGWHVLKNRSFEDGNSSLMERNLAENTFFRTSNFKVLPPTSVGIESLRRRLSILLFEHVKKELPQLRQDLEDALVDAQEQLAVLGNRRSTPADCRAYLAELSLAYHEVAKAAVHGHYEGEYFYVGEDLTRAVDDCPAPISRLRAVVQHINTKFTTHFEGNGHKYYINLDDDSETSSRLKEPKRPFNPEDCPPITLPKLEALNWVREALQRTRGKELVGNFNPLLVGELFWEQSMKWKPLAVEHVTQMARICETFLDQLLRDKCPDDVRTRLWSSQLHDNLKLRLKSANHELDLLIEDVKNFPINYNHYYTMTINKRRDERQKALLTESIENATSTRTKQDEYGDIVETHVDVDIGQAVKSFSKSIGPDMENFSCEEALDCLFAIYKVQQKTFIANVTTQVIERHIVRGLEKIFSPVVVNGLADSEVEAIASEPDSSKRLRELLEDRISKLEEGHGIFRGVIGSAVSRT